MGRVKDRAPEIRIEPVALGRKSLEGHDPRARRDAGDADAVVRHGGDGTGHVGAVAPIVEGVGIAQVQRPVIEPIRVAIH